MKVIRSCVQLSEASLIPLQLLVKGGLKPMIEHCGEDLVQKR